MRLMGDRPTIFALRRKSCACRVHLLVFAHLSPSRPSITALAPAIIPFVASGLSSLPPSLLRAAGNGFSIVVPALRSLMNGVDTIFLHAQRIWEAKKAAFASGDAVLKESVTQGGDLLSVLRTFTCYSSTLTVIMNYFPQ